MPEGAKDEDFHFCSIPCVHDWTETEECTRGRAKEIKKWFIAYDREHPRRIKAITATKEKHVRDKDREKVSVGAGVLGG